MICLLARDMASCASFYYHYCSSTVFVCVSVTCQHTSEFFFTFSLLFFFTSSHFCVFTASICLIGSEGFDCLMLPVIALRGEGHVRLGSHTEAGQGTLSNDGTQKTMPKDISVCWNIGLGVAFASSSSSTFIIMFLLFSFYLYTYLYIYYIYIIYYIFFYTILCLVSISSLSLSPLCPSNPPNTSRARTQLQRGSLDTGLGQAGVPHLGAALVAGCDRARHCGTQGHGGIPGHIFRSPF